MSDRLAQLIKFHEADPADTFSTYGIAMEHLKLGDSQAAIDWLDKTVQIDPDYAYAWYHKAATHGDLGQTDEAKAAIEAGLSAAQRSGDGKAGEELRSLQGSLA